MGDDDEMYDSLSDLRMADKSRPLWLHGASQHDSHAAGWSPSGSRHGSLARTYGGTGAHDRARGPDRPSRDGGDGSGPPNAAQRGRRAPPAVLTGGGADDAPGPKPAVSPTTGGQHEQIRVQLSDDDFMII